MLSILKRCAAISVLANIILFNFLFFNGEKQKEVEEANLFFKKEIYSNVQRAMHGSILCNSVAVSLLSAAIKLRVGAL